MSLKVLSTGVGLPQRFITNDDLVEVMGLDTSDEWIYSRTGIKGRYVCQEETLAELSITAARQALDEAELTGADIDYILCSTIAADTKSPSLACTVAEAIDASCGAVDLNGACTGFIYDLDVANALIATGRAKNILIVAAEKMSAHADWTDRRTCVLFGDGAAAVVVTAGNMIKYINVASKPDTEVIRIQADMAGNNPIARDMPAAGFVHMDGQKVFKYAVNIIENEVKSALEKTGLTPDDIDLYLLHQANLRIIDFAISRLKQPKDKFPTNIDHTGNTSSVSIPLLLHELRQAGQIKAGQKMFLCAFGAGMTYGTCVWEWE
ncbi:MAG: beta-ketoacyl-ACP synthase 3 [Propionibacteriaceae bacterium]|nr:beta-ketoacyl-ACP synthase 3 [Propionibacteriaceae bacterium]